jgi:hypothetical protein
VLSAEAVKEALHPAEFRAGAELAAFPGFTLRLGLTRNPAQVTFGFGVTAGTTGFDYAASVHPVLGVTHHAGFRLRRPAGD